MNEHNLDQFFLKRLADKKKLDTLQRIDCSILNSILPIFAKHLDVNELEAFQILRPQIYYAISAVTEVLFRFKENFSLNSNNDSSLQKQLTFFYESEGKNLSLGSSRKLRREIFNYCALAFGLSEQCSEVSEHKSIQIEEAGLTPSPTQKNFIRRYDFLEKGYYIPKDLLLVSFAFLKKIFVKKRMKVGYVNFQPRYFMQLPSIDFINYSFPYSGKSDNVSRSRLFEKYRNEFFHNVSAVAEWNELLGQTPNENILAFLWAIIVKELHDSSVDEKLFSDMISFYKNHFESQPVEAIFALGGWNQLDILFLRLIAKRKGIPFICYQLGGRDIYSEGIGYDNAPFAGIDKYFAWGWMTNDPNLETPKFYRIFDPMMLRLNQRGKWFRRSLKNNSSLKILYSPTACSHLYNIEHFNAFQPDQMKDHREFVKKSWDLLDSDNDSKNIQLFIKIKGWGYHLFKGFEYMLFPLFSLKNIKTDYLFIRGNIVYLNQCHIHVSDSLSTTFAESIAYNMPTLAFFHDSIMTIRPEYIGLFEEMKRVGLVLQKPEDLKNRIEMIRKNPGWWDSEEVQSLRNKLVHEFVNYSSDWKKQIEWAFWN